MGAPPRIELARIERFSLRRWRARCSFRKSGWLDFLRRMSVPQDTLLCAVGQTHGLYISCYAISDGDAAAGGGRVDLVRVTSNGKENGMPTWKRFRCVAGDLRRRWIIGCAADDRSCNWYWKRLTPTASHRSMPAVISICALITWRNFAASWPEDGAPMLTRQTTVIELKGSKRVFHRYEFLHGLAGALLSARCVRRAEGQN